MSGPSQATSLEPPSADALDASVRLARLRQRMFAHEDKPTIAQYHLLRQIGRGGMGLVFAAWDPSLDRMIAIKVLRDSSSSRAGPHLRREAMGLARLRHPNVVSVFEVGEHEGQVYLAMEYVAGETLRAWVRRWRSGRRELRPLLDLFVQFARGLEAAHRAGLVHRDVKPENVMIDGEGRLRLMDFGLARLDVGVDDTGDTRARARAMPGSGSTTSRSGSLIGTPAYMAPEQFRGGTLGPAADQFALCACLFEAVYGRSARPRRMDEAAQVADEPIDVPKQRGVPRRLQALLRRGLLNAPEQRWPSMQAVADELESVRRSKLHRRLAGAAVVVGLAGAGIGVGLSSNVEVACEAALDDTWSRENRAAVVATFERFGGETASELGPRVLAKLDEHAAAWSDMIEQSCRATFIERRQSEQLFDRRMRCLERRRDRLRGAVEVLLAADTPHALVERSVVAFKLPALEPCADMEGLASEAALPDDPELRERIATLRETIDAAETRYAFGDFGGSLERASSAVTQARDLEFRPGLAEALVMLGRAQIAGDTPQSAELTLREAILVAAKAGDPRSEAVAWTELIMSHTLDGEPEMGIGLELAALAAVERADDEVVRSWLLNNLGAAYSDAGEESEALDHLRRAIAVKQAALGEYHLDVAISWHNLAQVLSRGSAYAEAEAALEQARAIFGATVGSAHPMYRGTNAVLCSLTRRDGRYEAAIEQCTDALAAWEAAHGSPSWLSRVGLGLARAQWGAGRHEDARRTAAEARRHALEGDPQTLGEIDEWLADPDATERAWAEDDTPAETQ